MQEWWSYRPGDFLLFSPRTYWRLFQLANEALWPLQIPVLLIGDAILARFHTAWPQSGRDDGRGFAAPEAAPANRSPSTTVRDRGTHKAPRSFHRGR